ncbi:MULTISPECIES: choline kinase family protein [unclassified Pseudoalteromonas]|uniref:choline kinase family protein n=1 Tax=unclassified Pseudoalteromonas TaxID=194690 RepID=UPI002097C611|nr:choline kinase family protein [Pseudoalteromonas sp. XMcav2-N]MCO7189205.1 phosphotransferase [Pseudoalteromonas sp. XMcav2-N]
MPLCNAQLEGLLRQAFEDVSIRTLRPLDKGLSNKNYYLEAGQQSYLLKCYSNALPTLALDAQRQLAKIGVAQSPVAYDAHTRLALFDFVTQSDEAIRLNGALLTRLHTLHQFAFPEIGHLSLNAALAEAGQVLTQSAYAAQLCSKLAQFEADICFCHNDLVRDNILATAQGPVFIDFEYAQYNDRYFDLAALCTSFSQTVHQGNAMLGQYYALSGSAMPAYAQDKLKCYVQVYLLLSIAWYQQRGLEQYIRPLWVQLKVWRG